VFDYRWAIVAKRKLLLRTVLEITAIMPQNIEWTDLEPVLGSEQTRTVLATARTTGVHIALAAGVPVEGKAVSA
jgi:hypothetical protein